MFYFNRQVVKRKLYLLAIFYVRHCTKFKAFTLHNKSYKHYNHYMQGNSDLATKNELPSASYM